MLVILVVAMVCLHVVLVILRSTEGRGRERGAGEEAEEEGGRRMSVHSCCAAFVSCQRMLADCSSTTFLCFFIFLFCYMRVADQDVAC